MGRSARRAQRWRWKRDCSRLDTRVPDSLLVKWLVAMTQAAHSNVVGFGGQAAAGAAALAP
eukprot:11227290-Lingulodinium_polyedra.AAC.1